MKKFIKAAALSLAIQSSLGSGMGFNNTYQVIGADISIVNTTGAPLICKDICLFNFSEYQRWSRSPKGVIKHWGYQPIICHCDKDFLKPGQADIVSHPGCEKDQINILGIHLANTHRAKGLCKEACHGIGYEFTGKWWYNPSYHTDFGYTPAVCQCHKPLSTTPHKQAKTHHNLALDPATSLNSVLSTLEHLH